MRDVSGALCCIVTCCFDDQLCERCYERELIVKSRQADVIGQCWAERTARRVECRGRERWPDDERALAIAERLVAQLSADPRLRAELAVACVAGAAAWWERRPAGYRVQLETGPAEVDQCMLVGCHAPVRWELRGASGAGDDYARVCEGHLEAVRREGDEVRAERAGDQL